MPVVHTAVAGAVQVPARPAPPSTPRGSPELARTRCASGSLLVPNAARLLARSAACGQVWATGGGEAASCAGMGACWVAGRARKEERRRLHGSDERASRPPTTPPRIGTSIAPLLPTKHDPPGTTPAPTHQACRPSRLQGRCPVRWTATRPHRPPSASSRTLTSRGRLAAHPRRRARRTPPTPPGAAGPQGPPQSWRSPADWAAGCRLRRWRCSRSHSRRRCPASAEEQSWGHAACCRWRCGCWLLAAARSVADVRQGTSWQG